MLQEISFTMFVTNFVSQSSRQCRTVVMNVVCDHYLDIIAPMLRTWKSIINSLVN